MQLVSALTLAFSSAFTKVCKVCHNSLEMLWSLLQEDACIFTVLWCVCLLPPLSPLPPKTLPQAPGLILLQLDQIWPFSIIWEQWIPDYYSLLLHGELLSFSDKTFFSVLLKIGSLLMWKVWVGSAGKLKCDVRTMLENSYYSGDIVNRGKNYLKNCRFISFCCLTMFWRNQDLPHSKDYLFTSNWFQWQ